MYLNVDKSVFTSVFALRAWNLVRKCGCYPDRCSIGLLAFTVNQAGISSGFSRWASSLGYLEMNAEKVHSGKLEQERNGNSFPPFFLLLPVFTTSHPSHSGQLSPSCMYGFLFFGSEFCRLGLCRSSSANILLKASKKLSTSFSSFVRKVNNLLPSDDRETVNFGNGGSSCVCFSASGFALCASVFALRAGFFAVVIVNILLMVCCGIKTEGISAGTSIRSRRKRELSLAPS